MKDIENIVVATDFSPIADHALDEAIDLAKKLGARITLVHAFEYPVYGFPDGILVASAEVVGQLMTGAQKQLSATIEERKDVGVKISPVLREGAPWEEISAAAKEAGAGLIVVGTHGRRGLARAFMGSVAERLLRTASLPVLVFHGKEAR